MQKRRAVVSGLVIAGLAVAGACSDIPPTEPAALDGGSALLFGGPPADPLSYEGTLDHYFVRLEQQLPGFGGFYRGEDGRLNVVMKAGASVAPLSAYFGTFNLVEGQYGFSELAALKNQVGPVFGIGGVVYVDADEAANRVRIGVENAAAEASVEHALAMLGVDRNAVIVSHADPIVPLNLRGFVRPVAGGLQINWPGFLCTLGFNVRPAGNPNSPVQGFVTNSHCTNERGVVTGTPYGQPTLADPIGTEQHDLPFFACPSPHPNDFRCRWSDSAGARYASGVQNIFARIYRTTGENNGEWEISPVNEMFTIVAEQPFPFLGDIIHKVGRTTGWSSGPLVNTCVDTGVANTNIIMLCQEHVLGTAAGGDSGSPTFHPFPGGQLNTVRLNGILWGGGGGIFVFSAMNEIRFENGPGWITH